MEAQLEVGEIRAMSEATFLRPIQARQSTNRPPGTGPALAGRHDAGDEQPWRGPTERRLAGKRVVEVGTCASRRPRWSSERDQIDLGVI
jgi:hypothetical protein